jgi:NAD(P)-dependent dehydrogenase (short-subunit alcohol dehydrogenase family)
MTNTITAPAEVERPLAGRRAIVVGASRGLGRGVAGALAGAGGASVVAVSRSEEALREL